MKFDAVIIGGGRAGMEVAVTLQRAGLDCATVSAGSSLSRTSWEDFSAAGGTSFPSDKVLGGRFDADGRLVSLTTEKLGKDALKASRFVLASGKYFAGGLQVGMTEICEPIFGCDVKYEDDRSRWFAEDFNAPQPFMSFGVKVDRQSRVSISGRKVPNLYAAGEILSGIDGSSRKAEKEIQKSALRAAESILRDAGKDDK